MKPWWLRLARYAVPHRRDVGLTLFMTLVLVALDTLKPWPMKLIVDYVLIGRALPGRAEWMLRLPGGKSQIGLLAWFIASTVFLFIGAWACRTVRSYVQTGLGTRMTYGLGADLFDHLQRLSLRFHGRQSTGDLVQRVTGDCGCVQDLVVSVVMPLLTSIVSLVAMAGLVWRLDHSVALIALAVAPVMGVMIRFLAKTMADRRYDQAVSEGRLAGIVEQTLTALPMVQAFGRESHEDTRFQAVARESERAYLKTIAAELRFQGSTTAVTAVSSAAVLAMGGWHVLEGKLSIGSLLVLLSYVSSLYSPIETLTWLSSGFASAAGRARRVFEILDLDQGVPDSGNAKAHRADGKSGCGYIRLEHVTFGYDPTSPVLKDISLDVQPGETIALVGATGAGKSTLAALIMRFYDPDDGRIALDGTDLRDLRLASLRAQFSIVLQDPFILPLSVAENIAYGRPGATREQIVEAARAANADRFAGALPQGYDTVIGERGATLSGGERQRIAIARALLKDAPILILDEPTSALDAETEFQIMQALERLIKGRTSFIIAHRLSTIRRATKIIVLAEGAIVEVGSHEQLMVLGGTYRSLHDSMFGTSNRQAADAAMGFKAHAPRVEATEPVLTQRRA